jgi:hypothetical protein
MNLFSLFKFLPSKFAWSSFLILSKHLIGFISRVFASPPKYQKSRHNLRIGGDFSMLGVVRLSGRMSWNSAAQAAYRSRRRRDL